MTDPKQSTAKVVLNAIAYKEINDSRIGVPTPISVDITDLLKQHNVLPTSIYGVSTGSEKEGEYGESVIYTNFVVREADIRQMVDKIYGVIDAAIVNTNQGLAVKGLIEDILDSFIGKCWDNIRG
jgi:hypothetical protein